MDQASSRYQGKPLLRLLECYVLWAIDELPGEYEALMGEMTPKLYAVYGLEGRWQDVLQQLMEMPPGMPALIQETLARGARPPMPPRG